MTVIGKMARRRDVTFEKKSLEEFEGR